MNERDSDLEIILAAQEGRPLEMRLNDALAAYVQTKGLFVTAVFLLEAAMRHPEWVQGVVMSMRASQGEDAEDIAAEVAEHVDILIRLAAVRP